MTEATSDFAPPLATLSVTTPVTVSVSGATSSSYGGSLASASSVTVVAGATYLLTGTTTVNTLTSLSAGSIVTLVASGQSAGVCVVIAHLGGNIKLRDSLSFGLYAGESLTLLYDGTSWNEIDRNAKLVVSHTEITSSVNITATTIGTANTVITASAITLDGATSFDFEMGSPTVDTPNVTNGSVTFVLYEDGANRGKILDVTEVQNTRVGAGVAKIRFVPTNASHTYTLRAYVNGGTGVVQAGAGTTSTYAPAYLRISRSI